MDKAEIDKLIAENKELRKQLQEQRADLQIIAVNANKILSILNLLDESGSLVFSPRKFSKALIKVSTNIITGDGSSEFDFINDLIPKLNKYQLLSLLVLFLSFFSAEFFLTTRGLVPTVFMFVYAKYFNNNSEFQIK